MSTAGSVVSARVGRLLQPQSRRQRRAEDDGHHRRYSACAAGYINEFRIDMWSCLPHTAIGLGTLPRVAGASSTRWGSKITKQVPVGGFAAEMGAAIALMVATLTGVPVSTTHANHRLHRRCGATRRLSAVRRGVARQIVWAWVLTIPAAFAIGAATYTLLSLTGAR